MLKTLGYLISTLSVLMLGAVSWRATETDAELRLWLVVGMAASIVGMFCRWLSYRLQERPGSSASMSGASARRTS